MKTKLIPLLLVLLLTVSTLTALVITSNADSTYVDLTTVTPTSAQVGWGKLTINAGLDGQKIDMQNEEGGTTVYEKGLTAHAKSELVFDIEKYGATMFTAYVGAEHSTNNATTSSTSIQFFVYVDDVLVAESLAYGYTDPAGFLKAPIAAGAKTLKLVIDDCGGNTGDHGVWAEPRLLTDPEALKEFNTMELSSEKNAYIKGGTVQLDYNFKDIAGDDLIPDSHTFESSDETVATVDENGLVTSTGKTGTVRITLKATKGTISKKAVAVITFMDEITPQQFTMTSPDGNLTINIDYDDEGAVSYTVSDKSGQVVVNKSYVGVNTEFCDFSNALAFISKSDIIEHNDTYTTVSGKRSEVKNHYNELVLHFTRDVYYFDIYFRGYDDGFAYRFAIRRQDGTEEQLKVLEETGTFSIPSNSTMYAQVALSLTSRFCYEENYQTFKSQDKRTSYPCFPVLVRLANDGEATSKYLLLSESNLYTDSYAGSVLKPNGNCEYQMCFAPEIGDVVITTGFTSPWRFGIFGDIGTLVESDMTEKLADATDEDFSWVVPGPTAWMWVTEGFNGQRNEETIRRYIDLASEMGWKYLILDEGWQPNSSVPGKSYDGYFPYFDELVKYAESKGVGFIAWVLKKDLDTPEELDVLNEWAAKGIKGIKADFFDNEDQITIDNYKRIYERCAELKLVVNCHGANKPTGERRTYPNVINREAVNGEEFGGFWVNAAVYWAYTRGIVGPVDITPRLMPTAAGNTVGVQMACNIIFESGMPCMASRPEEYLSFNGKSFYKNLPAAWDDTLFLDGTVGSWVSMARRSGDTWYASSISVSAKKNLEMKLDFLGDGEYYAIIYRDIAQTAIEMESRIVTKNDTISYELMKQGGFNVKFIKANDDGKYIPTAIVPDKATMDVIEGIRDTITYKLSGEEILIDAVKFESSDPSIVSVSEQGDIVPMKEGKATITITSVASDKIKATVEINVQPSPYSLNNGFSLENQMGHHALSYILGDVNRIQLYTSLAGATSGKYFNELTYNLPEGDFEAKVRIDDFAEKAGLGGGVIVHLGGGKYVSIQRTYTENGNRIVCSGEGVKTADIQDFLIGSRNKPYIVKIVVKDGKLSLIGGFYENNTRTFATVDLKDDADLSVGLFAVTDSSDDVQTYEFSNFTLNGNAIPFALDDGSYVPPVSPSPSEDPSDEPSDEPSVEPSVEPSADPSLDQTTSSAGTSSKEETSSDKPSANAPSNDGEDGSTDGNNDDGDDSGNVGIIVAVVVAVAAVAAVAVVLVVLKKKKS